MALTLKGKLTDPLGHPIQNAQIEMRALRTSSVVVATASAVVVTTGAGEYTLTVEPGTYVIRVMFSGGHSWNTLAKSIVITEATLATNLNELILSAQVEDPDAGVSDQLTLTLNSLKESINKGLEEMHTAVSNMHGVEESAKQALESSTANQKQIEALNTDMRSAVDQANTASKAATDTAKKAEDTVAGVNDAIADIRTINTTVSQVGRDVKTQYDEIMVKAPAAITAKDDATNAAQRAAMWANAPEDQVVESGEYSAKHYALKAKQATSGTGTAGAGNFDYVGKWDFADNKYPTGYDSKNCFWLVTRKVTVESEAFEDGDMLLHTVDNGIGKFSRIAKNGTSTGSSTGGGDTGGAVKSVAGKTGAVELYPSDVGLGNVRNVEMLSKEEVFTNFATKEDLNTVSTKANNAVSHDEFAQTTAKLSNVAWDGAITSTTGYLAWERLGDVPDWIRQTHTDNGLLYMRAPDGTQFRVGEDTLDMFNRKGELTFTIGNSGQLLKGTVPESLITGVLPVAKGGTGSSDGKLDVAKLTMVGASAGMFFDKVGDYGIYPIHTEEGSDAVEGVVIGATSTSLAITNKGGLSFTGPNDEVIFEVDSTGTVVTGKIPYSNTEGCAPSGITKRLTDGGIMYSSGSGFMTLVYSNVTVNKSSPTLLKFAQPFHDTDYGVQITKKFGSSVPDAGEFAAEVSSFAYAKDSMKLATDYADDIVCCVTICGEIGAVGQDGTTADNSTLPKA